MASVDMLKKSRSSCKRLFTRANNSVQSAIKLADDHELVERKMQELSKRYSDVQESHESYICEVEEESEYNEEEEEKYIAEIEKTYSITERSAHSYIKQAKSSNVSDNVPPCDTDERKEEIDRKIITEKEKLRAIREFEKTELTNEAGKVSKIILNTEIDDPTRNILLKESQSDINP